MHFCFLPYCVFFDCDGNLAHTLTLREAGTCAARSWSLRSHLFALIHTRSLIRASLLGACVSLPLFSDGRAAECAAATWHH